MNESMREFERLVERRFAELGPLPRVEMPPSLAGRLRDAVSAEARRLRRRRRAAGWMRSVAAAAAAVVLGVAGPRGSVPASEPDPVADAGERFESWVIALESSGQLVSDAWLLESADFADQDEQLDRLIESLDISLEIGT